MKARNNIQFITSTFKALTVTRKKQPFSYGYTLNNAQFKHVAEEKVLGIIVTNTLWRDQHINATVSKANKMLGLLKRTFPQLTNVAVRQSLYLSLVKLKLCFGTQVWSPSHSYLQSRIEHVQGRTTQSILRSSMGEMSYKERLIRLDMLPLVHDRELHDITFFYKCLYGHTDLNVHNFFYFVTHGCTRQSNSFNLTVPICKLPHFRPLTSIGLSNYGTLFVKLLLKAAILLSATLKNFRSKLWQAFCKLHLAWNWRVLGHLQYPAHAIAYNSTHNISFRSLYMLLQTV